jgi:hypothetical protein
VAAAGASAALAGLVIVAISVNVERIIEHANLPPLAGTTIGSLVLILATSMVGLIPQSASPALGTEILVLAVLAWALYLFGLRLELRADRRADRPFREWSVSAILAHVQIVPFVVGAISLLAGSGGGLFWIAGGFLAIFVLAMANAWVLLVEILR